MKEAFKTKFESGSQVYPLQTELVLFTQQILSPTELPDQKVCVY